MPTLSIRASESILKQLRIRAVRENTTVQALVLTGLNRIGIEVAASEYGARSQYNAGIEIDTSFEKNAIQKILEDLFEISYKNLGHLATSWLITFNKNLHNVPLILALDGKLGRKRVLDELNRLRSRPSGA